MTVGEALTEARSQAGLSVEELSERTRIRGTIIRGIEQDDYEACGGDLYVRGYVRALAGAVGIDAQPLIREFDLGRSGAANGSAGGSAAGGPTGRHAESHPRATLPEPAAAAAGPRPAQEAAPAPEPSGHQDPLGQEHPRQPPAPQAPLLPPADLNATRYDMPSVTVDPAVTSYDLPRVPDALPSAEPPAAEFAADFPGPPPSPRSSPGTSPMAEFAAEYPTADFPGLMPPPPPPGAVPPGATETRYDLTVIPGERPPEVTEDLMAAGYNLGPAEPADPNARTQVLPALGSGPPAGTALPAPGQAGAERGNANRRVLLIVAAAVFVVVLGGLGYSFASRAGSTPAGSVASANTPAAAGASASAAARASARAAAAASPSASAAARAGASAPATPRLQPIANLPVASVLAFGPDGTADGDNPGNAANAIAASPAGSWATQWYDTPAFGMLKHGTGLLLDLGGKATVTTVRLDLPQYQGTDLQIRVGNAEALQALHVAAQANQVGGAVKLTLRHPVAARYLLIWFTQLPPNGSGEYQETVSHVSVAGRR